MMQSESYFILRVPLLAYKKGNSTSDTELKSLFSQPLLQEALFLASPALHERLSQFIKGELRPSDTKSISIALNKYLLRLSNRPTPFGLFAGIATGRWSDHTQTRLSGTFHRSTRLDTDYVSMLVEHLLQQADVNHKIKFFPNNTIYTVEDKIRYIEYSHVKGKRVYHLSGIDHNSYLLEILDHAQPGKDKISLAASITNDGISFAEAMSFVEDLIQNNLLVSELEIRLTGQDYFSHVLDVLRRCKITIPELDEISHHLKDLDEQASDKNLSTYPVLVNKLKKLVTTEGTGNYIQVDTGRHASIRINKRVGSAVADMATVLASLLPVPENKTIADFRRAFYVKYELKEIDLAMALDPEIGLGYPIAQEYHLAESSLLSEICFQEEEKISTIRISDFQNFLIQKYSEVYTSQKPLILRKDELRPFFNAVTLPASMYALVSVYASDEEAIDKGDFFIQLSRIVGPSAVTTMARFCHLNEELTDMLKETIKKEESGKDAVFAEIIHVNQPRVGNISTRPVLREYEIPILATGGVDEYHTLPVSDLALSIVGNKLILRSKKLNRQVIPRLSSAHNFSQETIAVYRFLCDLQYQDVNTSLGWDWGVLSHAHYLPSVRIENILLSPARWRLSEEDISAIKNATDLKASVDALRKKRTVPRTILIGHRDNKITIDLENDSHLLIFQKMLGDIDTIEECIFNENNTFIQDTEGNGYVHELIIPLTNPSTATNRVQASFGTGINLHPEVQREFTLGTEWLYYKIYCNTKAVDHILLEVIKPLTKHLLEEGIINKWFFVRYCDPQNHIRLRLHGKIPFYHSVIDKFQLSVQSHIKTGMISNVITDTYSRELERYGDTNIVATESFFFAESEFILEVLEQLTDNEHFRWQIALLMTNELFDIFNVHITERQKSMNDLQQQFFEEMKGDQLLKSSLASSFRNNRKTVEEVMHGKGLSESILKLINQRTQRLRPIANDILGMANNNTLPVPVLALLQSYIHMSLNRLFPSHPRHYEMVLYDFLLQFYNSQLARSRKSEVKNGK